MRLSRLYQAADLRVGSECLLDKKACHYLSNVLRLALGDRLVLFNGDGYDYLGHITQASKKSMTVALDSCEKKQTESILHTHLGQALARGEKMDFILQKTVELGINEITPLLTERCGVKLSNERIEKRMQHWQSVIISACEQCGRSTIPTLHAPRQFQMWVSDAFDGDAFILHPNAKQSLSDNTNALSNARIAIGPEGGFSEPEVNLALSHHFHGLSLGPRVLRTETAALAALSVLQYQFGDFNNVA